LFFLDWPALEPQSMRPHMQKRRRPLRANGRCCMRARCMITEHLADRRKSPVWSAEATYLLGSTAGVPEGRSTALIYAGAPQPELAPTGPGQVVNLGTPVGA
jgi:hypothetical protein